MYARRMPSLAGVTVLSAAWLAAGYREVVHVDKDTATVLAGSNDTQAVHAVSKLEATTVTTTAANFDRISCSRQDDLDMVIPHTDEQIVRMVIGIGSTTDNDVYISASDIQIKTLNAVATLKRFGHEGFEFEISGDEEFQGDKVASVNFWITGVDLLLRNTWMNWGASLAADRNLLAEGQDGTLKFKITGRGQAFWNSTTAQWDIEITEKQANPFQFHIDNQAILQKVLNNFGGIDQIIMNAMWPAVTKALPKALIASFNYLTPEQLSPEVEVRIDGKQTAPGATTTKLNLGVTANFDTIAPKLFKVFRTHFDAKAVARTKMQELLNSMDIEELWETNKPMLRDVLGRYGLKPEILDMPYNKDAVYTAMVESAAEKADWLMAALQPLIDLGEADSTKSVLDGIVFNFGLAGGWTHDKPLMYFKNTNAGGDKLFVLPSIFMDFLGLSGILKRPPPGSVTSVGHEDLLFEAPSLKLARFNMQDVRVKTGGVNGTPVQIFKVGGKVKDVELKLPESWNPGYKIEVEKSNFSFHPNGDFVGECGDGLQMHELPKPAVEATSLEGGTHMWKDSGRTGDGTDLDGKIPEDISRPLDPKDAFDLHGLIPEVELEARVGAKGARSLSNRLTISIASYSSAEVSLRGTLKSVLAPRPVDDFGYTFAADVLERKTTIGEQAPTISTTYVVVSCGYLRLYNPEWKTLTPDNPLKRLDMNPDDDLKQLELDLTKYNSYDPTITHTPFAKVCLDLYKNGYPARQVKGWWSAAETVKEEICGPILRVQRIAKAIDLQVKRFASNVPKAALWDYGTHPANETQYQVPEGFETRSLTDIFAGLS